MTKKLSCCLIAGAIAVAGCASSSKDVATAYVSPLQYQSYDCEQLGAEARRIQVRVVELGGRLDKAAENDKALFGVGMILFWPALFALGGTKAQEAEYGRLRGEYDAVQQSAIAKKCTASPSQTAAADGSKTAAPVGGAEFVVVDRFTQVKRRVEVHSSDIARGTFPGLGDLHALQPPGGWVPADAETQMRWSKTYTAEDGSPPSEANLDATAGPRQTLTTPTGTRSVVPVVYEGWVKRNVGYGDLVVSHKATFKIWYDPATRLPVKFESDIQAPGGHTRKSSESVELVSVR